MSLFLYAIIISLLLNQAIMIILRILPLKILLLAWAESTIAEFNSNVVFIEVGRTICLCWPKRLGRAICWHGLNPSCAKPSGTPYLLHYHQADLSMLTLRVVTARDRVVTTRDRVHVILSGSFPYQLMKWDPQPRRIHISQC